MVGKFIVLDGTDGSGKATQTALLVSRLKAAGHDVETADFPQYGRKSAGLVEEYLNGKYGSANEVDPRAASIFYAVDRYDASFQIRQWLTAGKIVIANRYTAANMGHQGAKFVDPAARKNFLGWLDNLEYEIFKIPRPDLNIILHVPAEISQELVDQKAEREYINGKKRDIHEADINHLKAAEAVYLEIAKTYPNFRLIECVHGDKILSREEIAELVWQEVIKIVRSPESREAQSPKVVPSGLIS
ncbi:MAG: thymidylate kinase [Patescibacteria group bacterium]|jgi:dTMP kinase